MDRNRGAGIDSLIARMGEADFYPHEVVPPVSVIQTHISYVVLTGLFAYKVKKPVDLGFLDFTSLEKRRFYCEEELRLNRIFAPELYVDVVPIFYEDGHFSLGGSDDDAVVEYAVRMRQFDNRALLTHVFDRGELDGVLASRLGTCVARAHGSTPRIEGNDFGTGAALAESARIIFSTIGGFVGEVVPESMVSELRQYVDTFLMQHGWLFGLRVNEGRVRECHGDLHLGNICMFEGRIELFDRIEFNDAFKNIDVMYDLAFLLMDLRFRGRGDLSNRVVNAYVEGTGDYSGILLLPFYECMRALIRGEVALLLSADDHVESADQEDARQEGLRYLRYAQGYSKRTQGSIVVICGVSGSGKSTVARTLAERAEYVHIRSDVIRKHLAGIELQDRDPSIYSEAFTGKTYGHLLETGVLLAERGHKVILDAQFGSSADRAKLLDKAGAFDVPVQFVWCHAPEEELRRRLNARVGDVSDATAELIESQRDAFEPLNGDETALAIHLDTSDAKAVERLISTLRDA